MPTGELRIVLVFLFGTLACSGCDSEHARPVVQIPEPDMAVVATPDTLFPAIGSDWLPQVTIRVTLDGVIQYDAPCHFRSLDSTIVSVDARGRLTAHDFGTAKVIVSADSEDYALSCADTVLAIVSWKRLTGDCGVSSIASLPVEHQWVYAAVNGGEYGPLTVLFSADGMTWHSRRVGLPGLGTVTGLAPSSNYRSIHASIAVRTAGGYEHCIYHSQDAGSSWMALDPEGLCGGYVADIVVDPQDDDVLYCRDTCGSFDAGLRKSTDAGLTWHYVLNLDNNFYHDHFLGIDPHRHTSVYADHFRSDDAGATWIDITHPVACISTDGYRSVTLYAWGNPALISTDHGDTWSEWPMGTLLGDVEAIETDGSGGVFVARRDALYTYSSSGSRLRAAYPFQTQGHVYYVRSLHYVRFAGQLFVGTGLEQSVGGSGLWLYRPWDYTQHAISQQAMQFERHGGGH